MRTSIPGTVISILLAVLLLVVTPMYYVSITQWTRSQNEIMSETAELIDKVIDTKVLTDDMMADFNLVLAAQPFNYTATITRETLVVNPDPMNPGSTYSTYVLTDNLDTWKQGDIITIKVEMFGDSIYASITKKILGLSVANNTFTLAGRVR